jgi:hypothetical protein
LFITSSFDQYANLNPVSRRLTLTVVSRPLPWICCAHRGPCCQPVVAAALAAYLKEEQPMMTVVLIYMSGFLVVVAALLVAMIKTTARPNR